MTYLRTFRSEWGTESFFECDRCEREIYEGHPRYREDEDDFDLCVDCAFIEGIFSEEEYLRSTGFYGLNRVGVAVKDGKVVIYIGKPPWERTDQDLRNTSDYKSWRTSVFERDDYTCQNCGQVGRELNAHHIKPFAKYKKLRYEVSNGITLCLNCHRDVHRKEREKKKR